MTRTKESKLIELLNMLQIADANDVQEELALTFSNALKDAIFALDDSEAQALIDELQKTVERLCEKTAIKCVLIIRPDGSRKEFMFAVNHKGESKNLDSIVSLAKDCNRFFDTNFTIRISPILLNRKQIFEANGLEMP